MKAMVRARSTTSESPVFAGSIQFGPYMANGTLVSYDHGVGVIENMSAFTCDHGERYELFGAGGGQTLADEVGVPLLGKVPLEAAVAKGGDTGRPVALADAADGGPAAAEFAAIAARLDEVAPGHSPPDVDMSGCTARLLASVSAALDGT